MKLPSAERLTHLWQVLSLAGEIRDIARQRRTYVFHTTPATTFYLRATRAEVRISRWTLPRIEVQVHLEAAFGWRVASEQDEAGVYMVAHRRRVIGQVSNALFAIAVPQDAYLILRLDGGRLALENLEGTLQIPPPDAAEQPLYLLPE